jgi:hypothetical protein
VTPLALSDEEMTVVLTLAAPIERARRDAFLRAVTAALAASPARGAGVAHCVAREIQRAFFDPPQMSDPAEMGARSRSPKVCFAVGYGRR